MPVLQGWPQGPRRPHHEGDEPSALPAGAVESLIRDHTLQSVENQIFVSYRALFAVNPVRALRLIQKTADQTLEMLGELGTDLGHPGEPGSALTDPGLAMGTGMEMFAPMIDAFKPMLEAQRIQALSAAIRNLKEESPARRSLEAELLKLVPEQSDRGGARQIEDLGDIEIPTDESAKIEAAIAQAEADYDQRARVDTSLVGHPEEFGGEDTMHAPAARKLVDPFDFVDPLDLF